MIQKLFLMAAALTAAIIVQAQTARYRHTPQP